MGATETFTLALADTDVLEAFYQSQTNTITRFLQLSKGPAELGVRQLDLGAIRLLEASGDGMHIWTDEMLSDEWRIAFLRDSDGPATIGGLDILPNLMTVIRPGEALGLATQGRYATLELNVSVEFVAQHGWDQCCGQSVHVPPDLLSALVATAQAAFAVCDTALTVPALPEERAHWLRVVADVLDRIFQWWIETNAVARPSRGTDAQADIVLRVARALRDIDYAKSANIDGLCRDIGVSRRSMFLAFQKQVGVGPRRFNELVRLHQLRARLFRAEGDGTTVTKEAEALGFGEMGRLASTYRAVFGEAPSATLKYQSPVG